ncbi:hypothetical protein ISS37_09975 [candidate division KSB1 bacterium]|nr:hypothetical protein [candidate division KSB1 bacterium]
MSELTIAFITIFGTVASVSGVVAYVFNGTKKLIKEMHATNLEMHATLLEIHKEGEQRHQEVIELLKRGFGDLAQSMAT